MNVVPPAAVVKRSLFGPERPPYGFTFLVSDEANYKRELNRLGAATSIRYALATKSKPGWRNWQTRRIQNPMSIGRAGSSPAPGTELPLGFGFGFGCRLWPDH